MSGRNKAQRTIKESAGYFFSTSFEGRIADLCYEIGAQHYMRKPGNFAQLKTMIHLVLTSLPQAGWPPPLK